MSPAVSFVVPARDEAAYLPDALDAIAAQTTDRTYETVVVADRRSDDGTVGLARERDVHVVEQERGSIGRARDLGAQVAAGEWLAFVDADTRVRPSYLDEMLATVEARGLDGAAARCRLVGPVRAKPMEWVINHLFPRLRRPVLPGFNCLVDRECYEAVGGFPDVPNEDTAFSRRLGREFETGYCEQVLVETSARRIARLGLTGTLLHYLWLDLGRLRAQSSLD